MNKVDKSVDSEQMGIQWDSMGFTCERGMGLYIRDDTWMHRKVLTVYYD